MNSEPRPMFYNKNGWILIQLARDIINMDPGDRLPTIAQYAEQHQCGRGTVQTALNLMIEQGCFQLEKQGRLGSTLHSINKHALWKYTDWNALYGFFPIPSSNRLAMLVASLNRTFADKEIPFNSVFVIASQNRLQGLELGRCSFVLTTRLAARSLGSHHKKLETVMELDGTFYSSPYVLVHRPGERYASLLDGALDGKTIAVSPKSCEQEMIYEQLSRHNRMNRMEMNQQDATWAFLNKKVDCLLSRSELFTSRIVGKGTTYCLTGLESLGLDEDSMRPVLVANRENYGLKNLLQKQILPERVAAYYEKMANGDMPVSYY